MPTPGIERVMMEKAGKTRAPWRSWTILALVLMVLALAQACSDSNRTTTPTTTKSSAVALKIKRAPLVPPGCSGKLVVDGPNGFHTEVGIPSSGQVTLSNLPTGVPLQLTAFVTCGGQTASGSTTVTLVPGVNNVSITVVLTKAGISCNPSTIAQGGESTNCACTIQVPDPSSFTVDWQGATPTGPTTAKFTTTNATPLGSHTVTCTVNNVASASTTVTVNPAPVEPVQNGFIRVDNIDGCGECGGDILDILIDGVLVANDFDVPDPPFTRQVSPGQHTVQAFCFGNQQSQELPAQTPNVPAGGTVNVTFDSNQCD